MEIPNIEYFYHLTHKKNLPNILKYGLVSHNEAHNKKLNIVDISMESVIKKRGLKRDKIHNRILNDYVPLYFNPKNPMLYVRKNIQNELVLICTDPKSSFNNDSIFTDGNAASNQTNFYNTKSDLQKLNWENIFAKTWFDKPEGREESSRIRCAEILIYPKINISSIRKVFCNNVDTKQYISNLNLGQYSIKCELNLNFYFPDTTKWFVDKIIENHNRNLFTIEKFAEIINRFSELESVLNNTLTPDNFFSNIMASGQHGIGHVTRVMFWVHFFNVLNNLDNEIAIANLYAAFIHDLAKEKNLEDEEHGRKAANKYKSMLEQNIPNKELLDSSINAIIYHSIEDDNCPVKQQDITWKIIKDADALDRCRYGQPNSEKGCNTEYLRQNILNNNPSLKSAVVWLAYEIARLTSNTNWGDNSFMDLREVIIDSMKTALKYRLLTIYQEKYAKELLNSIKNNQE